MNEEKLLSLTSQMIENGSFKKISESVNSIALEISKILATKEQIFKIIDFIIERENKQEVPIPNKLQILNLIKEDWENYSDTIKMKLSISLYIMKNISDNFFTVITLYGIVKDFNSN